MKYYLILLLMLSAYILLDKAVHFSESFTSKDLLVTIVWAFNAGVSAKGLVKWEK